MSKPDSKTDSKSDPAPRKENDSFGLATDLLESETANQITSLTKEWSSDATKFIKKNPWVAVIGAAAIGYYLGATGSRGRAK